MLSSREAVSRTCAETTTNPLVEATCLDGVALKPTEVDVEAARDVPLGTVAVDYEGTNHVPDTATLERLASDREVRVTVPVRVDGFDPLGDHGRLEALPAAVEKILVAGNPAYLDDHEQRRRIAPRLGAAVEQHDNAWVGTEGIERLALATGVTQFELLSRSTPSAIRGIRSAGFGGDIAVYAPTVLTDDEDEILDAIGAYLSRRTPVARALPDTVATDSTATGRARSVLLDAATDHALVGSKDTVHEAVVELREEGADTVVGYPARGLDEFVV
jgi:hypothetical protein